jgi:hypothetical protein
MSETPLGRDHSKWSIFFGGQDVYERFFAASGKVNSREQDQSRGLCDIGNLGGTKSFKNMFRKTSEGNSKRILALEPAEFWTLHQPVNMTLDLRRTNPK